MTSYNFTKTPVSIDRLTQEVQQSAIVTALDHMTTLGSALTVTFKATLSETDEDILNDLVDVHSGTPLAEAPQSVAIASQPAVVVSSSPAFASKTLIVNGVTKKLYARNTGIQASVVQGTNTITYTATYTWTKLLGVEAVNCEALDTVDFKVYDTAQGTYSGYANALLNQFSYTLNLPKDFYQKLSQFDADLYAGMVIQITYVSQSAKIVGLNLLMNEVK